MTATKTRYVSVTALADVFQELVTKGELRQIEFNGAWAGRTGYFEELFRKNNLKQLDVAEGELVLAVDDSRRWLLIGKYLSKVHVMFQRYTAKEGRLETCVVYQSPGVPNALAELLDLSEGEVNFDNILEFIGAFTDGTARAAAIDECLITDVSDILTAADGAAVSLEAVEPTTVNPTSKENETMNTTSSSAAASAAAQGAATGAAAVADAVTEAVQEAAANPTANVPGGTIVVQRTSKLVGSGLFVGGMVAGAAATVGGYFAYNKWFRNN